MVSSLQRRFGLQSPKGTKSSAYRAGHFNDRVRQSSLTFKTEKAREVWHPENDRDGASRRDH